ncbi:MAG: zinc ribbon domain-containing protein [Clostridia bacterium]|nr:zinc ribbon domain-containing protein [Clostridia bacterium]
MAFFEDLGKKLSCFGQSAAQKTKDLTEIARLVAANADRSRKIDQLYTEIGKAYYAAHKDDAFSESAAQIVEITTLTAEIAAAQDEINRIKGLVKCANCGADVEASNAFCNACGAKIEVPAAEEAPVEEAEAAPETTEE